MQHKPIYEFGAFRLNSAEQVLLRDGQIVSLTPKVFEILIILVENAGRLVEKEEILQKVWADSFVEEAGLAKNVSLLRKVLSEDGAGSSYIETVPKRGYRFTAEVKKIESEIPVEKHTPIKKSYFVHFAVLGLLIATLGVLGYWLFWKESGWQAKYVAVLPFKPLQENENDKYLGLGMADALIIKLGQLNQLIVRPTSEVRQYVNQPIDAVSAGKKLEVESVLEGTIQRTDDRIRITVQMLNVSDGRQIWADSFEEKSNDIFAIQDKIALRVANSLISRLTNAEEKKLTKHRTENTEAFQAYTRGNFFARQLTKEGFDKAVAEFNKAIELDPSYSLPYAGLALAYSNASEASMRPHEAMPKAKSYVEQALKLDETLPEALDLLGWIKMNYDWDWDGAESTFKKALEANPLHENLNYSYSFYLANMGRRNEASGNAKTVEEINPLRFIGPLLYRAGEYDQTIIKAYKAIEINPNRVQPYLWLGLALEQKGVYEEALAAFAKAREMEDAPLTKSLQAHTYAVSGKRDEALKLLADLQEISKQRYVSPFFIATIYVGLGEKEKAFEYLEKAYQERSYWMVGLKTNPRFDPLRNELHFQDLLKRMKL